MASGMTSSEYIAHHLTNLTYGKHPVNGWSFAQSGQEVVDMGFMSINVDSMVWSVGLGAFFIWLFSRVARTSNYRHTWWSTKYHRNNNRVYRL